MVDVSGENTVFAVFRPRLSDHFEFNVSRLTAFFNEDLLDDFHIFGRQRQLLSLTQLSQLIAVQIPNGDVAIGFLGHVRRKINVPKSMMAQAIVQ
jgi:hypothetical protein